MIHEIWWSLPLTLIVFFLARMLAARFKFPLLNPLLVAMVVLIPFLLITGISYERYFQGSKILNDLLQPAVVAPFLYMSSYTKSALAGNQSSLSALSAAWWRWSPVPPLPY